MGKGKLRQVPLEDLNPMSDEVAYADGVQVRMGTGRDGAKTTVIVPRAFARLSQEATEVVAELQRKALQLHQIREQVEELVAIAREVGASWAVIGWSVGTTGDAARQRWSESS